MKNGRFSDAQIMGILKQSGEAVCRFLSFAESMG